MEGVEQGQDRNGIKENGAAAYPIITWKRISHFETIKHHIIVTEAFAIQHSKNRGLVQDGVAVATSPQIILWGTLISMILAVQCCAFTR